MTNHPCVLGFWHPVASSRAVARGRVLGVRVAGTPVAVFRTAGGELGAVADQCAHRRMTLSLGSVAQGRLVCPYHGWSYDAGGNGESPSAPRMHACIRSYQCAETSGAIWIRTGQGGEGPPSLEMEGWDFAGADFSRVRAPLELVIDNFSEVEHTVATHPDFGFDLAQAGAAVMHLDATTDSITVRNDGPAKMPPLDTRLAIGIRRGDRFHSDYTFRFDPPRSSVLHRWTDPRTGSERLVKYRVLHYFVAEDEMTTQVVSFGFLHIRWPLLRHFGHRFGWVFRRKLHQTVAEDAYLLEHLADKSPGLEGMVLGRFDAILRLTRERLQRIYYGVDGA